MTVESPTSAVRGLSRRTVLRTAAWSVPVVAAAAATPLAAASTPADLELRILHGDEIRVRSDDQLRGYSIGVPSGMFARSLGSTPVAAGSTIIVSYDNRLFDAPSLRIDSVPVNAQSPSVSGNKTTVTFTSPAPIPTTEPGAAVSFGFGVKTPAWYTDVEPISMTILPPTGSDSDSTNNGWTSEARYFDTIDAVVSATWIPASITTSGGSQIAYPLIETVTITASAPGDIPSGGSLMIGGPTVTNETQPPYTYVDPFTDVRVTSAVLDGVDVRALIGTPVLGYRPTIPVNTTIPAGQSLVLTLSVDAITRAPGYAWAGGFVQFSGGDDRNSSDNNVQAPTV